MEYHAVDTGFGVRELTFAEIDVISGASDSSDNVLKYGGAGAFVGGLIGTAAEPGGGTVAGGAIGFLAGAVVGTVVTIVG